MITHPYVLRGVSTNCTDNRRQMISVLHTIGLNRGEIRHVYCKLIFYPQNALATANW